METHLKDLRQSCQHCYNSTRLKSELIWLDKSGQVWTSLDNPGQVWTSLYKSRHVWTTSDKVTMDRLLLTSFLHDCWRRRRRRKTTDRPAGFAADKKKLYGRRDKNSSKIISWHECMFACQWWDPACSAKHVPLWSHHILMSQQQRDRGQSQHCQHPLPHSPPINGAGYTRPRCSTASYLTIG